MGIPSSPTMGGSTQLSLSIDTDTEEGLAELMRESALVLLRNLNAWTHVLSLSNSLNIDRAEQEFDKLSFEQRSKFNSETLSNVDGKVRTKTTSSSNDRDTGYIVVTLILGTADDLPLFDKINTEENLREAIIKLAQTRDDYLMKFELLWTPQQQDEYLTDEELLLEYTDIIPLA